MEIVTTWAAKQAVLDHVKAVNVWIRHDSKGGNDAWLGVAASQDWRDFVDCGFGNGGK